MRRFRNGPDRSVDQFYQWAYADVFTNIIRAAIAEYIVACAIGKDNQPRSSWFGYDFDFDGIKIEVKSSACFVSGKTPTKSNTYDIGARSGSWHPDGTLISVDGSARRCADVYVFAFHWQADRELADTLDVSQWRFYVVPTAWLNMRLGSRKTVSRDRIAHHFRPVPYDRLREAIIAAASSSMAPAAE
jgi:hypothetical protein